MTVKRWSLRLRFASIGVFLFLLSRLMGRRLIAK
jgi:hypothetical protein